MTHTLRMLIVCDPTENAQPTLDRAVSMLETKLENVTAEVTILLAVDFSRNSANADNDQMYCDGESVRQMAEPLRQLGVTVNLRISWSNQWADSVLYNANAIDATSILVSAPSEKSGSSFTDEFWLLIRNSPVPVALIQGNRPPPHKNIIAALYLADKELEGLNSRVMQYGIKISDYFNIPLHLVSAYANSDEYPDRGRLVKLTGLPNENIHLRTGDIDDALSEVTPELDTDLLIVGAARRTGIRAALRGRKLSGILHKLDYDILFVV